MVAAAAHLSCFVQLGESSQFIIGCTKPKGIDNNQLDGTSRFIFNGM